MQNSLESLRITRELTAEIETLIDEIRALTAAVKDLSDQLSWRNWHDYRARVPAEAPEIGLE